jgi:hypothetical protein
MVVFLLGIVKIAWCMLQASSSARAIANGVGYFYFPRHNPLLKRRNRLNLGVLVLGIRI